MDAACTILKSSRRIAVLGMSPKPHRTSHQIAQYLLGVGYEIIPVNPGHAEIIGLTCYPRLQDVPAPVDIVDVFRAAEHEEDVAKDVLAMPGAPQAVWFQLNAGGFGVEQGLREAGIEVFVDSCIKVVHSLCRDRG
jgi:predicted CoA-binding protein